MRSMWLSLLLLSFMVGPALAQDTTPRAELAESPLAKDLAGDVTSLGSKWTQLFGAMPPEKLDWRPAKGVRSVREVFTHIGDANVMFLMIAGIKIPDMPKLSRDQAERENRFTSKAEIADHVKRSFELAASEIAKLTEADLNREVNMFGRKTSVRNALLVNVGHMHEHLGQSIAYARVIDVKPPWSGE